MPDPVLSPALTKAGIRHAFFTRSGGVSEGIYTGLNGGLGSDDNPAHVAENRRRMAEWLGVAPEHFLSLYQVHSPDALHVTSPWPGERPKADGMVTSTSGVALAVGSADCGPILFADTEARIVGACHSGWKGAIGGVLESTIAAMEKLGSQRARIIVALGPMLSQANYEVGPEFRATFLADDSGNADFFRSGSKPDHPHFDLPGYIARRLEKTRVGAIEDCGLCTYADETRFYSYRRKTHRGEADYGRLMAAIRL
ncbi:MAG: peptidoglycan editing factor PgeF [Rhabdaerophilum sp.]